MASNKFLILLALAAVAAVAYGQVQQGGGHSDQGGPHQNQGRVRRQLPEDEVQVEEVVEDDIEVAGSPPTWVDCDFSATPKLTCLDCNTRLICKPFGGLVRYCKNPRRPYCNNGICSDIPSAECA